MIVTAPARVMLTSLNPEYQDRFIRRNATSDHHDSQIVATEERQNIIITRTPAPVMSLREALDVRSSSLWESFEERNNIKRNSVHERNAVALMNLINHRRRTEVPIFTRSVENFNSRPNVVRARHLSTTRETPSTETNLLFTNSLTPIQEGQSLQNEPTAILARAFSPSSSASNAPTEFPEFIASADSSQIDTRRPLSPLIRGFGSLLGENLLINMRNRQNDTDTRQRTVFERNFQSSRTQASITKLGMNLE